MLYKYLLYFILINDLRLLPPYVYICFCIRHISARPVITLLPDCVSPLFCVLDQFAYIHPAVFCSIVHPYCALPNNIFLTNILFPGLEFHLLQLIIFVSHVDFDPSDLHPMSYCML